MLLFCSLFLQAHLMNWLSVANFEEGTTHTLAHTVPDVLSSSAHDDLILFHDVSDSSLDHLQRLHNSTVCSQLCFRYVTAHCVSYLHHQYAVTIKYLGAMNVPASVSGFSELPILPNPPDTHAPNYNFNIFIDIHRCLSNRSCVVGALTAVFIITSNTLASARNRGHTAPSW